MKIDITEIVTALLGLCAALITGYLIPWIKSKMTISQYEKLEKIVQIAVTAAEQLYGAGCGEQKMEYVLLYLESKGITADRAVIEAKVKELFGKDLPTPELEPVTEDE